jgi:hypothetical protein
MHEKLILLLVLSLAAPAFAAHESGPVGPYNVSFNMNTTMKYRVIVEAPSSGVTSLGVNFARYNLTIDSADYLAWLILTRYEEPMVVNISTNEYIVYSALLNAGADKPNLYQPLIDGKPGVLGNFRFERQFLGQGQYQEGDLVIAASYSPDARVYGDGVYRGRTDCRVISTFPWEIIRDLIYTLHIEALENHTESAKSYTAQAFRSRENLVPNNGAIQLSGSEKSIFDNQYFTYYAPSRINTQEHDSKFTSEYGPNIIDPINSGNRVQSGSYPANSKTKVYHEPGCTWAGKIVPKNQVWFSSPTEAEAAGYRHCEKCL